MNDLTPQEQLEKNFDTRRMNRKVKILEMEAAERNKEMTSKYKKELAKKVKEAVAGRLGILKSTKDKRAKDQIALEQSGSHHMEG